MKTRVVTIVSLLVLSAALTSYTDAPFTSEAANLAVAPAMDVGMRIHIDPVTGELLDHPPQPGTKFPLETDALNTSTVGLVEEDSPVSGKMVNLQGRFQHNYTATVDAAGSLNANCDLPESTDTINKKSEGE